MTDITEIESSQRSLAHSEARPMAIGRALVCLDRSELSDACLPCARFIAEAFGAQMTLFHVMPARGTHEPDRVDPLQWEIAKREAEQYLARSRSSLGIDPERTLTHLTQGLPADQIVSAAREIGTDLTILSSQGEGGTNTSGLGSTAQHVLALAAGSVLLVPPPGSSHMPPSRILVPLDGSLRSECVLPLVADMARVRGAEVLLVHVVTDPTPSAVLSRTDDIRLAVSLASRVEANAVEYLARVRGRLLPDVPSVRMAVVRRTEEKQALLDVAAQQGADMLVLTAHGSTCNADRAFGSVASYLLAHANLPAFVFQDMPRHQVGQAPGQRVRATHSVRPLEAE